jgi:hypothetical protein
MVNYNSCNSCNLSNNTHSVKLQTMCCKANYKTPSFHSAWCLCGTNVTIGNALGSSVPTHESHSHHKNILGKMCILMGTHVHMLNNIMFVHMKTPYVPNLVNIEFPQTWEQVFPHGNPMFSVGGIHSHGGEHILILINTSQKEKHLH